MNQAENNILHVIGRSEELFTKDIHKNVSSINSIIEGSSFLVIGGAGSIGKAVTKEIFKRNPAKLHVVDISENNLVELVRELRSSIGYIDGDFKTFAVDCGSLSFERLVNDEAPYDYVLNLSALKHVRSEKDPYTLMRMIDVNVVNTIKTLGLARQAGAKKYFCVSTDKAANPANLMGATKRIMEKFMIRESATIDISMARFANVAFSDGSLPHGFNRRMELRQPISAPRDVRRYFVTPKESGELCLLSALLGENRDVFFPKLVEELRLTTFSEIAQKFLLQRGYTASVYDSEEEARKAVEYDSHKGCWPCYFFDSDTSGEKDFEEFFTALEVLDLNRFEGVGVIKNELQFNNEELDQFSAELARLKNSATWKKGAFVDLIGSLVPNLQHRETGKSLEERM